MAENNTVVNIHTYQGIASPLQFNSRGNLALLRDRYLIQEDLRSWIMTSQFEPFMEPMDGVGLDVQLFDPNDETQHTIVASYVKQQLGELEPRVEVVEIKVAASEENSEESNMIGNMVYRIPAITGRQRNVYPFLVPGEGIV